jgi:hypothetical protein
LDRSSGICGCVGGLLDLREERYLAQKVRKLLGVPHEVTRWKGAPFEHSIESLA